MPLDQWKRDAHGRIAVKPMMGYSLATVPLGCMLRVEYAESIEDIDGRRPKAIQFAMSGPQARELAQGLLRMADHVDRQPKGTAQ